MLADGQPTTDDSWSFSMVGDEFRWTSTNGAIALSQNPFRIVLYDSKGKEMTDTRTLSDNDSTQVRTQPFQFIEGHPTIGGASIRFSPFIRTKGLSVVANPQRPLTK